MNKKDRLNLNNLPSDSFHCVIVEINGIRYMLLIPIEEEQLLKLQIINTNILMLDSTLLKH